MTRILLAACAAIIVAAPVMAKPKAQSAGARPGELILYQDTQYSGDWYTVDANRVTIQTDWNIRSIAIHEGDKWQICAKPRFRDCIDLTESLPDASVVGVQGQLGSIRKVAAQ